MAHYGHHHNPTTEANGAYDRLADGHHGGSRHIYDQRENSYGCFAPIVCLMRYLTCGCWSSTRITRHRIEQESLRCCSIITDSMELENVTDISLKRGCFSCCCNDMGTIRVYGSDPTSDAEYFDIKYVTNSRQVFEDLAAALERHHGHHGKFRRGGHR